ncbi:MAG TPA: hypothetical protein VG889_06445 [Rhizomicrobium sp.]|nr:hypothetical protein [Rhizomicrobium sp.]
MPKPKVKYVSLGFRGDAAVPKKRVKQPDGKMISIHSIDADSPTFDWELSTVFAKNVARARRANEGVSIKTPIEPIHSAKFRHALGEMTRAFVSNPVKSPKKKSKKSPKR